MARKRHVRVDQDEYVRVLGQVGVASRLDDIAAFLEVSETTARRKLDGLVAQKRVVCLSERPREYALVVMVGGGRS